MWTSILGLIDKGLLLFNQVLDWWNRRAIKESGVIEERNRSNERTLERIEIAHGVDLEPVPHSKHIILDGM
jgi:hypothetical protein